MHRERVARRTDRPGERGQALTEYMFLLSLVAIAAMAGVAFVGAQLGGKYDLITAALRGW